MKTGLIQLLNYLLTYSMEQNSNENRLISITYLLTYLLTLWSRVLLENLTEFQLVKKFSAFYGT